MKKKLFCCFAIVVLGAGFLKAQELEDNPVTNSQKARQLKVQSIKEMNENNALERIYKFDENGNLVSDVRINQLKTTDSIFIYYTYNAINQLIKKKNASYINPEGDIVDAAEKFYEYDAKGNLAKRKLAVKGEDTTRYSYFYNPKGILETILVDSIETRRYRFLYDSLGLLKEKIVETPVAKSTDWMEFGNYAYKYDDKKRMTKETYISEETEKKRSQMEYNMMGKLGTKTVYVYSDTKPTYSVKYHYDPKTQLLTGRTLTWIPDKSQLNFTINRFNYIYSYRK